jgi:hypothetical protein
VDKLIDGVLCHKVAGEYVPYTAEELSIIVLNCRDHYHETARRIGEMLEEIEKVMS